MLDLKNYCMQIKIEKKIHLLTVIDVIYCFAFFFFIIKYFFLSLYVYNTVLMKIDVGYVCFIFIGNLEKYTIFSWFCIFYL